MPNAMPNHAPPQHARSRRRLWIMVLVVLLAAGSVTAGLLLGGGSPTPVAAPDATVRAYLADLAAGDAAGALAQGVQSQSGPLLTDSVLRAQQQAAHISNVRIVRTTTQGSQAIVEASYTFGKRQADASFALSLSGSRWLLQKTTLTIEVASVTRIPAPTVFGTPASGLTNIVVFPGPITWKSGNKFFQVEQPNIDQYALYPTDPNYSYGGLNAALNPQGVAAANAAVERFLQACARSTRLAPPGCGLQVSHDHPVPNTAHWTQVSPQSQLVRKQDSDTLTTYDISGMLNWNCRYEVRAGSRTQSSYEPGIQQDVEGSIDMNVADPVFTSTS